MRVKNHHTPPTIRPDNDLGGGRWGVGELDFQAYMDTHKRSTIDQYKHWPNDTLRTPVCVCVCGGLITTNTSTVHNTPIKTSVSQSDRG